jgi:uncharacterized membrane protein
VDIVGERGVTLQADIRARIAHSAASTERVRRLVYGATATYAALFAAFSSLYYVGFGYARFDLGNMTQAVWSTTHGRILETTSLTGDQMIRLASHVDPILILLSPLWWAWSSPTALLVLQAVAVSAGALPVYWLARKHLASDRAAAHFAFAYLLFPATQFNAMTLGAGFHAVSLALPLILFAIWFLDEDRLIPFAVVAILAASTKEEIPAAIGCLGIWYALRKGHLFAGLAIFASGVGAALVNFMIVIPHFAGGLEPFAGRYEGVGGTPSGILHKAVTDPASLLHVVFTGHKAVYLVLLVVPLLGLWLLEPLLFLGALPDLVINLLSSKPEQTLLQYQYTAGIVPFLVAAAILGARRTKRDANRLSLGVLVGVLCFALYSPIVFGAAKVVEVLKDDPRWAAERHALDLVPQSVPVAVSNHLGSRLSARQFVYVFPRTRDARWIVLDRKDETLHENGFTGRDYRRAIAAIERSPRWATIYRSHGIVVLRRR